MTKRKDEKSAQSELNGSQTDRSKTCRYVTASQPNPVSLYNRPCGDCVRVRLCVSVCVSRCTAGPPTRWQWERMSTSLITVSVGGQRLSVWFTLRWYKLHYPASCFSVTVCKRSQQPPWPHASGSGSAAAIGDGSTTSAHMVRCTQHDADRQVAAVSLTRSHSLTCCSHATLPHTHYLDKSSFKALHVHRSDCCNGWCASFINPHILKSKNTSLFLSVSGFSVFCVAFC